MQEDQLNSRVMLTVDGPFGEARLYSGEMRLSEAAMTSTHYKPNMTMTVTIKSVDIRKRPSALVPVGRQQFHKLKQAVEDMATRTDRVEATLDLLAAARTLVSPEFK